MLGYLNGHFVRSYTRAGSFVTAFYAVLDPASRTLTYSTAGHNPPRLVHNHRVDSLDKVGSLPLGVAAGEPYREAAITMERRDLLLLYTDGITEAMAPAERKEAHDLFGVGRLDDILLSCGASAAGDCINRIRAEVIAFAGNTPPTDDQTLMAIRCL